MQWLLKSSTATGFKRIQSTFLSHVRQTFKLSIFLFSIFTPFIHCFAQTYGYSFKNLSEDVGIADANIASIIKDDNGFVWFASSEGLNRYDGTRAKVYHHANADTNSISHDNINVLFQDKEHRLWIGTRQGLNLYDPVNDNFKKFLTNDQDSGSISNNEIWAIAEDYKGGLWIGTMGGGLNKLIELKDKTGRITSYKFKHYENDSSVIAVSSNIIWSIAFDKSGNGWVGTDNGLNQFSVDDADDDHISFRHYVKNNRHNSIANNSIWKVFVDKNDNILLISFYGMLDYIVHSSANNKSGKISFIHLLPELERKTGLKELSIFSIIIDKSGRLCIGTTGDGFIRCAVTIQQDDTSIVISDIEHYLKNEFDNESLIDNTVYTVYEDDTEIIWCGTGKGVAMYMPQKKLFDALSLNTIAELRKSKVNVACNGNQHIYLAKGNEIWVIDSNRRKEKKIVAFEKGTKITSLAVIRSGGLIIATNSNGLFIIKKEQITATLTSKPVPVVPVELQLSEDPKKATIYAADAFKDNQILIAGYTRLGVFDCVKNKFDNYFKSDEIRIFRCLAISNNIIYAGADDGLFTLNTNTGQVTPFVIKKGKLSSNRITSLLLTDNRLWIGTISGLNVYNLSDQSLHNYATVDGLSDNNITALCDDNLGNMWIGSRNGLSFFDKKTGIFSIYNVNEGLNSNQVHAIAFDGKNLFVAGDKGVNTIEPSLQYNSLNKIKIAVLDFKVAGISLFNYPVSERGQNVRLQKPVTVSWRENQISIEITALDYKSPQAVHYAYKLRGFDKDWVYNGTYSQINYTNLPGGDYVLNVKYRGSNGIWTNSDIAIPINVSTAWYRTWWFYLLNSLLVTTLFYTYYRIQLNRILELMRVRNKIARDLHDDIGSTLSTINIISGADDKKLNTDLEHAKKMLKKISESSGTMIESMSDIVWSINPANDKFNNMTVRMREYAASVLEPKEINYSITADEGLLNVKVPIEKRKDFFLIYKEAINNLAKYSSATNADICLNPYKKGLVLSIQDNGKGFDAQNGRGGNGLRNMKQRAEQLGGKLTIVSIIQQGTHITLTVPVF